MSTTTAPLGPIYRTDRNGLDHDMELRVDGLLDEICAATGVPRAEARASLLRVLGGVR